MRRRVKLKPDAAWTEERVCRAMAYNLMRDGRSVLVVPNCHWTGHECDLLVIEPKSLRIVDVEVKISRADLRADIKKDKWWKSRPWRRGAPSAEKDRREWPANVWKHYYVLPCEVWDDGLLASIPETSGVLLLDSSMSSSYSVKRQAKPNPDAKPISPADAVDIARLASLRMWSALATLQQLKEKQT